MTGSALTTKAPPLPGLLPDVESKRIIDDLLCFKSSGYVEIRRELTLPERRSLESRVHDLSVALNPISLSTESMKRAAQSLALMFAGFPSLRKADAEGMTAAYIAHLTDMPAPAIAAACNDIATGRVVGTDPDYPPSSARVAEVAREHAAKLIVEKLQVEQVLKAAVEKAVTDEQRERVREKFTEFAKQMVTTESDAELERLARIANETKAANERLILAEYQHLGVAPVRGKDGLLISPSLAKSLGVLVTRKPPADEPPPGFYEEDGR